MALSEESLQLGGGRYPMAASAARSSTRRGSRRSMRIPCRSCTAAAGMMVVLSHARYGNVRATLPTAFDISGEYQRTSRSIMGGPPPSARAICEVSDVKLDPAGKVSGRTILGSSPCPPEKRYNNDQDHHGGKENVDPRHPLAPRSLFSQMARVLSDHGSLPVVRSFHESLLRC
jgi:hypothetical protein